MSTELQQEIGPRLISLDGPSASGKSTLARRLAKSFDLEVVPELRDWVKGRFPPRPITFDEHIVRQRWFLQVDLERHQYAADAMNGGKSALIDRGPLEHFRFQYACAAAGQWPPAIAVLDEVAQAIGDGRLRLPKAVLFLDASRDQCMARQSADQQRRIRGRDNFDETFFAAEREFMLEVLRPHWPAVRVIDADADAEQVFTQAHELLEKEVEHRAVDVEKLLEHAADAVQRWCHGGDV